MAVGIFKVIFYLGLIRQPKELSESLNINGSALEGVGRTEMSGEHVRVNDMKNLRVPVLLGEIQKLPRS